jgi:hypothetical protein
MAGSLDPSNGPDNGNGATDIGPDNGSSFDAPAPVAESSARRNTQSLRGRGGRVGGRGRGRGGRGTPAEPSASYPATYDQYTAAMDAPPSTASVNPTASPEDKPHVNGNGANGSAVTSMIDHLGPRDDILWTVGWDQVIREVRPKRGYVSAKQIC